MYQTTAGKILLLTAAFAALSPLPSAGAVEEGETPWRWIGIRQRTAETCPPPPPASGWQVAPLFPGARGSELRRFCLYERESEGDPRPLDALSLAVVEPDILGVAPQGSVLADVSWRALETHFHSQAGQVALPAAPAARIRLTVLDASPTGAARGAAGPEDTAASSPHGTALLNMARDLLCDAGEQSCRATVASRLVLAWKCLDPSAPAACRDGQAGGFVGLIGELAAAIHREVEELRSAPAGSRLVLNLSLGWQQGLGGDEPRVRAMPVAVQAVYRALEAAACAGVLPIVAAGNREASARPHQGPFLPALWENRPAPDPAECRRQGLSPAPGLGGAPAYRPLVFSAAGVTASGEPLATTREGGVARLAAFGDHAVVAFSGGSGPTGTLTGSSVASLVVAAAAAAAWSYEPAASAFEVMAGVYGDGTSLGRSADYCLGGGAGSCPARRAGVRRVTLCQAVAGACGRTGACAAAPACPAATPLDLAAVDLSAFANVQTVAMGSITQPLASAPPCGGETVLYDGTKPPPADPCPHHQYEGPLLEAWTEPQPISIPCPNCIGNYNSPGMAYFEVDDRWRGRLTSATLRCGQTSYALGLGPLQARAKVRLEGVPTACLTAFPTYLSFVYGGSRAVLSPLLLCQGCR